MNLLFSNGRKVDRHEGIFIAVKLILYRSMIDVKEEKALIAFIDTFNGLQDFWNAIE